MDLWIRGQEGLSLLKNCGVINSSGVVIIEPSCDKDKFLLMDKDSDTILGFYNTAQDCVDILNEIQKLIICAIRDGKSGVVFSMPTINRKESKENEE